MVSPVEVVVDGDISDPAVVEAIDSFSASLAESGQFGDISIETNEAKDLALVSFPLTAAPDSPAAYDSIELLRDNWFRRRSTMSPARSMSRAPRRSMSTSPRCRTPTCRSSSRSCSAELRPADHRLPLDHRAGQGDRDEPAQRRRGLWRDRAGLPEGLRHRSARLPADPDDRIVAAALPVQRAVRSEHGLSTSSCSAASASTTM